MGTIKSITFIVCCLLLAGCMNNASKQVPQHEQQEKYALREMLDSCLQAQPNANNNDVTRSILADTLKSKFQCFRGHSLPYIEDLPFQYEMCLKYHKHLKPTLKNTL